jgi:hypothetical protein
MAAETHTLGAVTRPLNHASALLSCLLLAGGLAACSNSVATSSFTGEEHEIAQAISNLQADATAGDEKKLCTNDLAASVVAPLNRFRGGCTQAIKNQLAEIDSFELSIKAVRSPTPGTPPTATATVKSTWSGKSRLSTVSLVKEAGKWKVSAL